MVVSSPLRIWPSAGNPCARSYSRIALGVLLPLTPSIIKIAIGFRPLSLPLIKTGLASFYSIAFGERGRREGVTQTHRVIPQRSLWLSQCSCSGAAGAARNGDPEIRALTTYLRTLRSRVSILFESRILTITRSYRGGLYSSISIICLASFGPIPASSCLK